MAAAGTAAPAVAQPQAEDSGGAGEDPFDAQDFQVTQYVNRLFPNGASRAASAQLVVKVPAPFAERHS